MKLGSSRSLKSLEENKIFRHPTCLFKVDNLLRNKTKGEMIITTDYQQLY